MYTMLAENFDMRIYVENDVVYFRYSYFLFLRDGKAEIKVGQKIRERTLKCHSPEYETKDSSISEITLAKLLSYSIVSMVLVK